MISFGKLIGKRVLGQAKDSVKDQPGSDTAGGVNWKEYNYPPCITVIHFDPEADKIPTLAKKTVLRMKYNWYYAIFILFFNVWSNVGFAATGVDRKIVILYSMLQLAIGTVLGGVTLYQGYRGIAGDLVRNSRIYLGVQAALTILMLVFASVQSGNVHGYEGCSSRATTAPQPGYLLICVLEGTMWMVCAGFSVYNMYRVWKYPGHDRAGRSDTSAAKSEKVGNKRSKKAATADEEEAEAEPAPKKSSKKGKSKRAPEPEEEV